MSWRNTGFLLVGVIMWKCELEGYRPSLIGVIMWECELEGYWILIGWCDHVGVRFGGIQAPY